MLEELAARAGAEVVAAELFFELFVAVDDAQAGLNAGFGRIAAAALAHGLERSGRRWERGTWYTSSVNELARESDRVETRGEALGSRTAAEEILEERKSSRTVEEGWPFTVVLGRGTTLVVYDG